MIALEAKVLAIFSNVVVCGFASTEEGNALSLDGQKRKLELVVETANAIWGRVDT